MLRDRFIPICLLLLTLVSLSAVDGPRAAAVGDIVNSILAPDAFASLHGPGWVLMAGQNIEGSKLHTVADIGTLPDARGMFLRGKQHARTEGGNPDGDLAIGQTQSDTVGPHTHGQRYGSVKGHFSPSGWEHVPHVTHNGSTGVPTASNNGTESRPRNITINIYIKID